MKPRGARPAVVPPVRPMIVAHRGASFAVAEHTLDAYKAAIESGADAVECDVRLTRDGHLVCVHDRTVNRTSDGRGVVSELDLPSLERLDFASWHGDLPPSADQLLSDSPYHAGVAADRIDTGGRRPHPRAAAGPHPRLRAHRPAADRDQTPDPVRRSGREDPR